MTQPTAHGIVIQHDSEIKLSTFIHTTQLQRFQELFSDVIQASVRIIDLQGVEAIPQEGTAHSLCQQVRMRSLFGMQKCDVCDLSGVKHFLETQKDLYECPFGFKQLFVPIITRKTEVLGFVVIGPLFIGRKKIEQEFDREFLETCGFDLLTMSEMIRKVPLFTFKGIEAVSVLLKDVLKYIVELEEYKTKIKEWLPELDSRYPQIESPYNDLYRGRLFDVLLDVAYELTHADAGSILVFSPQDKKLHVQLGFGLQEHFVRDHYVDIDRSVAGHVFRQGVSVLLTDDEGRRLGLSHAMRRQEIASALLIPLKAYDDVFGVLCLTAFNKNRRFNNYILRILDKLGELSGVAMVGLGL